MGYLVGVSFEVFKGDVVGVSFEVFKGDQTYRRSVSWKVVFGFDVFHTNLKVSNHLGEL